MAWVVEAGRHSPGTSGAWLWIDDQGERGGTIGGGIMELELEGRARDLLQGAADAPFFEVKTLHHRRIKDTDGPSADGEPSGLICAGSQTNLLYLCRPEEDGTAVEGLARHGGAWCFDGSGPRPVADGDWPVPAPAGQDRWYDPEARCFWQRPPGPSVAVVGAGHCGEALVGLLLGAGFRVSLWDPRQDRLEAAGRVHGSLRLGPVEDYSQVGERLTDPHMTSVIVMTPGVEGDVEALAGALPRGPAFIGVMGSAAKRAEIFRRLRRQGLSSRLLDRITAPVGLPIGSRTPAEIAVSVAAQLIARRSGLDA